MKARIKLLWSYLVCLATSHVDELRIEPPGMWLSCVRCHRETPGIGARISRPLRFQQRLAQDRRPKKVETFVRIGRSWTIAPTPIVRRPR